MKSNNRIIVDLNKVQHSIFFYRNQYGQTFKTEPTGTTVYGQAIPIHEMAYSHPDYPGETMLERARRLDNIDVWTPVLRLKLTANECLEYTGQKAMSLRDAWNAKIFGEQK